MKTVRVELPDGSLLCNAELANNLWTRGVGLLARKGLDPDKGLLIEPCTSVHTWFMLFALDVLFLDNEGTVVKVKTLKPFWFSFGGKGAKRVLEIKSGSAAAHAVKKGDRLLISEIDAAAAGASRTAAEHD